MVGVQTGTAIMEIRVAVPQNPSVSLLGTSYYRDTCPFMFIAALFIITRNWKQSRCLPTDVWIMKMKYIYRWNVIELLRKM